MSVAEEVVIDIFDDAFQRDSYDTVRRARTLAPAEARIAIPRIVARLDDLELATADAAWAATRGRTLESLPLAFSSADRSTGERTEP